MSYFEIAKKSNEHVGATRLAKFLTTLIYSSDLVTTTLLTNHSHSDCVGKANPHRQLIEKFLQKRSKFTVKNLLFQ